MGYWDELTAYTTIRPVGGLSLAGLLARYFLGKSYERPSALN